MPYTYENRYRKIKKSKSQNDSSYPSKVFNQFIICCFIILGILVLNLINTGGRPKIKHLRTKIKNIIAQNNLILDFDPDFNLKTDLKKIRALDFGMLNANINFNLDKIKILNKNLGFSKDQNTDIIEIDPKVINEIIREAEELDDIKKKLL